LKKQKKVEKRRALYLANIAWLCPKPSLQELMPREARIQKQYYNEPHSDDFLRQKELLPEEIRTVLHCQKDFELQECPLTPPDPNDPVATPATDSASATTSPATPATTPAIALDP
jgi:hypothetical protein